MSRQLAWVAAGALLLTSACAMPPAVVQPATMQNLQVVRQSGISSVATGEFKLAPGKPARMDRTVVVRAGALPAPKGSYAIFLKDTLEAELQAAGKLDPKAGAVISGLLTRSEASSDLPTGRAAVGATFTVTKAGKVVYEKALLAETEWASSFIGAVEIPIAMDHYTSLYTKLVGMLLADPEFQAALRP